MSRVSIGDLDYYYALTKKNIFNPDVMKISSYHKQRGDLVNFVTKEVDVHRPFDIYYIIKEKEDLPNPPVDLMLNRNVRGWGKGYQFKINGSMPQEMLICRPDYLLYPEMNTQLERAEQVRFLDNQGKLLPILQNWHNTFKNKKVIITDKNLGAADIESLRIILKMASEYEKIVLFEPIGIEKLLSDKSITELFLNLKGAKGACLKGRTVRELDGAEEKLEFMKQFKEKFPSIDIGTLPFQLKLEGHGSNKEKALETFERMKKLICFAKRNRFKIRFEMPKKCEQTPYYFLFNEICVGTRDAFTSSGLEFITKRYSDLGRQAYQGYWSTPRLGNEMFRDLLRQTYQDDEFLRLKNGEKEVPINDIPGIIGKKEFNYGI